MSTYNVAIVGPASVITGFSALGAKPFPAQDAQEAQVRIAQIVKETNDDAQDGGEKYAVILVIEDFLRAIPERDYKILTKNILPNIVAIPGVEGSTGYMTERLREFTIRAIGSDIV